MHNGKITRLVSLGLALIFLGIPIANILTRTVNVFSLLYYLTGLCFFWNAAEPFRFPKKHSATYGKHDVLTGLFLAGISMLPLLYFSDSPTHYHQDEFITAYTSWTLPGVRAIDWFAAYPETWVSRFPILFHILQKPWLILFGPTVSAVRASILPYAAGITLALFTFCRLRHTRLASVFIVFLYIFFAPRLYLESMGLHFISSVFFFIWTIVSWLFFVNTKNDHFAVLAGFFAGLGFLTYTSSYAAFPVAVLSGLIALGISRAAGLFRGIAKMTAMTLAILAPFLTYAATVNNFFLERVGQVSVFGGSWADAGVSQRPFLVTLGRQTTAAITSLVLPGIGGQGGYNFGQLGLLDPMSAVFVLGGLVLALLRIAKTRSPLHITLLVGILLPFMGGFVLTIHPPPFHRISLLFPLIAFLMGEAIIVLIKNIPSRRMTLALACLFLLFYAAAQISRTEEMIRADSRLYPQSSRVLAEYLVDTFPPGTAIRIAAYPSFYLEQELFFRTRSRFEIKSDSVETVLLRYREGPLIVLNATGETKRSLAKRFGRGTWISSIAGIDLGDLALFTTK